MLPLQVISEGASSAEGAGDSAHATSSPAQQGSTRGTQAGPGPGSAQHGNGRVEQDSSGQTSGGENYAVLNLLQGNRLAKAEQSNKEQQAWDSNSAKPLLQKGEKSGQGKGEGQIEHHGRHVAPPDKDTMMVGLPRLKPAAEEEPKEEPAKQSPRTDVSKDIGPIWSRESTSGHGASQVGTVATVLEQLSSLKYANSRHLPLLSFSIRTLLSHLQAASGVANSMPYLACQSRGCLQR